VVGTVRDPVVVAVEQCVAGVADAITVGILLIGVGHRRAVVGRVGNGVVVAVGRRVAGIADAVTVAVGLVGIRHGGAVVAVITYPVAVGVGTALDNDDALGRDRPGPAVLRVGQGDVATVGRAD